MCIFKHQHTTLLVVLDTLVVDVKVSGLHKTYYPWHACTARVVLFCLSVSLSVPKLAFSKFIHSTNNTSYLTHNNKGAIICGIFSEAAPMQKFSTPSV